MNIQLDMMPHNKGHVFIRDMERKIRMKFWFYGNGTVVWRNFDPNGKSVNFGNAHVIFPVPKDDEEIVETPASNQTCPQCGNIHFADKYSGCCTEVCEKIMEYDF